MLCLHRTDYATWIKSLLSPPSGYVRAGWVSSLPRGVAYPPPRFSAGVELTMCAVCGREPVTGSLVFKLFMAYPTGIWLLPKHWLMLVGCWKFTSWQHLRSYQDGHWLVTVRTHGGFIVLPNWGIRPPAPWLDTMLSTIVLVSPSPVLLLILSSYEAYQFSKSMFWFDQEPNYRQPAFEAYTLPTWLHVRSGYLWPGSKSILSNKAGLWKDQH